MATLYALAHFDDELFCMGRILDDLINSKDVVICHMCGNDKSFNIWNEKVLPLLKSYTHRTSSLYTVNVPMIRNLSFEVGRFGEEEHSALNGCFEDIKKLYNISKVVTVAADNHLDHSNLNRIVKHQFRPDRYNIISDFYEFSVPGSDIGLTNFTINNYKTLSQKNVDRIKEFFNIYEDEFHERSKDAMLKGKNKFDSYVTKLQYYGKHFLDAEYAETYHCVFKID